ncbi:hypothetical protein ACH4L7_37675 [Streptomyces anulatus]
MDLVDLMAVATASLTLPITFLAALWARRSGRQSAEATVVSGVNQAHGSVAAARVQTRGELELRQQAALADASAAFLQAPDLQGSAAPELGDLVFPHRLVLQNPCDFPSGASTKGDTWDSLADSITILRSEDVGALWHL